MHVESGKGNVENGLGFCVSGMHVCIVLYCIVLIKEYVLCYATRLSACLSVCYHLSSM